LPIAASADATSRQHSVSSVRVGRFQDPNQPCRSSAPPMETLLAQTIRFGFLAKTCNHSCPRLDDYKRCAAFLRLLEPSPTGAWNGSANLQPVRRRCGWCSHRTHCCLSMCAAMAGHAGSTTDSTWKLSMVGSRGSAIYRRRTSSVVSGHRGFHRIPFASIRPCRPRAAEPGYLGALP